MENAFYSMLKVIFILEIFTFLTWLFGYLGKRLLRKLRLISRFMTSHTGQQMIIMQELKVTRQWSFLS